MSTTMRTYERALISLVADDPEDTLLFHRLLDAPPDAAERGTAQVVAIHASVIRDYVTGFEWPKRDDWQLIAEKTSEIEQMQEQIIARWRAADRLDELRAMPYRSYLRTPEWQARRLAALDRAGRHCQACNADANLDVHHRTYERRGEERDGDLTVLCRSCHGLFHEHRDLIR